MDEDGVEGGVYHVVIVVVAVTTTTTPPLQEPEPEPEPELESEVVETGAAGVLGLELGLELEPGALYDSALELADGVLWMWPGAAREEDTMADDGETGELGGPPLEAEDADPEEAGAALVEEDVGSLDETRGGGAEPLVPQPVTGLLPGKALRTP